MNLMCGAAHWHWRRLRPVDATDAQIATGSTKAIICPYDTQLASWGGTSLPHNIRRWVHTHSAFLGRFEKELGLTATFRETQLRQPTTNGRELLVWTSYHATTARCADPTAADSSLKRALFFDCMPRRLFSENVWRCLYAMHRSAVHDFGAGSKRGSKWQHHFHKHGGAAGSHIPGRTVDCLPDDLKPLLGAPLPPTTSSAACVVVVPERFRIKISSNWGNLHIDHAPLPEHMDRALADDHGAPAAAAAAVAPAPKLPGGGGGGGGGGASGGR